MTATPSHTYWPQLDGLRAAAVGIVLVGHAWLRHFHGAGVGVALFFALSGFLITGLLVAEREKYGRIDLPRFYGRRAVRLLPAVVLMLAVTWPVLRAPVMDVFASLFYFANWWRIGGNVMGPYGHMWSLSVEEQFYILWPLVLLALYAWKRARGVFFGALGLGVLSAVLRLPHGVDTWRIAHGLDTRMDALLAGAVLALGLHLWPSVTRRVVAVGCAPAALYVAAVSVLDDFMHPQLSYLALTWCCALVVGRLVTAPHGISARLLSLRPVVWLGSISYGMYLWHYPVQFMVTGEVIGVSYAMRLPAVAVLTVLVAAASFYLVERPLSRRLRPHLVPGPTRTS